MSTLICISPPARPVDCAGLNGFTRKRIVFAEIWKKKDNRGLRQPNESIRCGTVWTGIVYSARIGPLQRKALVVSRLKRNPQPSELTKRSLSDSFRELCREKVSDEQIPGQVGANKAMQLKHRPVAAQRRMDDSRRRRFENDYGWAASEAWKETTRHCCACRTYTFVNRQSSESSLPLIWRVRCRRPLTTAASPYVRMRMSEVA